LLTTVALYWVTLFEAISHNLQRAVFTRAATFCDMRMHETIRDDLGNQYQKDVWRGFDSPVIAGHKTMDKASEAILNPNIRPFPDHSARARARVEWSKTDKGKEEILERAPHTSSGAATHLWFFAWQLLGQRRRAKTRTT
jgi:hypothetical protein